MNVFALRPMIGHVSPHHRVDPQRTVREVALTGITGTIQLIQRRETSPAEVARADELIELVGLGDRAETPWQVLSQGDRSRALIARGPGLATVLVTHHLEELPASTTHALLLRGGRILAAGPAAEVLTSELASACFGHPVSISRNAGRWAAVAVRP